MATVAPIRFRPGQMAARKVADAGTDAPPAGYLIEKSLAPADIVVCPAGPPAL